MKTQKRLCGSAAGTFCLVVLNTASAGHVEIVAADFQLSGDETWSVSVTLQHGDTGWNHYADNWRVVDGEGSVLGDRVLHHPHVDEQPFTRRLGSVRIPEGDGIVYIEAHDKVHGWTQNRLEIDLADARVGVLRVEAK